MVKTNKNPINTLAQPKTTTTTKNPWTKKEIFFLVIENIETMNLNETEDQFLTSKQTPLHTYLPKEYFDNKLDWQDKCFAVKKKKKKVQDSNDSLTAGWQ